ncbi:MAG TPA: ribokinase [Chloroflexota bacterium]|nr:ribokinase [Chloroflexota bacterium]
MIEVRPRVAIVGSANIDMIIQSERLPRPGETVTGGEFVSAGGGKGANQAIAAHRLGAQVTFVARVGDDGPGKQTLDNFVREGLDVSWIAIDPETPTGVALILVDRSGQNMISVAPGANRRLSAVDVDLARQKIASARVLLTQLEIPITTVRTALTLGKEHGLTTVLNPAPAAVVPDDVLALVDWLTPNESEATALVGFPVVDPSSAIQAARQLLARGPTWVVVTRGEQGAIAVCEGQIINLPALPVAAVDATAAGDAFSAALSVGLARNWPVERTLRYASGAGALTATKIGAQPSLPTDKEVWAYLASDPVTTEPGRNGG